MSITMRYMPLTAVFLLGVLAGIVLSVIVYLIILAIKKRSKRDTDRKSYPYHQPAAQRTAGAATNYCPFCGNALNGDSRYCPYCGNTVKE